MKLYELAEQYRNDVARLQDLDLPPEAVLDTIDGMQGEITEKIKAVLIVAMEFKANGEARIAAAKKMIESGQAEINRSEGLMSYAQIAIQNSGLLPPIRYDEFTVNLAKNPPSCTVTDESIVPDSFKQFEVTYNVIGEPAKDALIELVSKATGESGTLPSSLMLKGVSVKVDKKALLSALKSAEPERIPGAHLNPTAYRVTIR